MNVRVSSDLAAKIAENIATILADLSRDSLNAAAASVSNKYDGQAEAVKIDISTAGALVTIRLNYDPATNLMIGGKYAGISAYWIAEFGRADRAPAPVIRRAKSNIERALGGLS